MSTMTAPIRPIVPQPSPWTAGWQRVAALGASATAGFFGGGLTSGYLTYLAFQPPESSDEPFADLGAAIFGVMVGFAVGVAAAWVLVAHLAARFGNPHPIACGFLTVVLGLILVAATGGAGLLGIPVVIAVAAWLADAITGGSRPSLPA